MKSFILVSLGLFVFSATEVKSNDVCKVGSSYSDDDHYTLHSTSTKECADICFKLKEQDPEIKGITYGPMFSINICWCIKNLEITDHNPRFLTCRFDVPSSHESSVKIDMNVHTTGYYGYGSPHIQLQLNLNPLYQQQRVVPETCYVSPSESVLDPRKFYLIENRFPTFKSRVKHTPTTFSSSSALPESVFSQLYSAPNPYVRCKVRLCPLASNGCNFGYGMTESEKYEQMMEEMMEAQKNENTFEERVARMGHEQTDIDEYRDEPDEIVYVGAKLL